jgi:hypothetical protein
LGNIALLALNLPRNLWDVKGCKSQLPSNTSDLTIEEAAGTPDIFPPSHPGDERAFIDQALIEPA